MMEPFLSNKERFCISAGFTLGIVFTYILSFFKFFLYDYLNWQYSFIIVSLFMSTIVPRFFRMRKQVGTLFDLYKVMSPTLRSPNDNPIMKILETVESFSQIKSVSDPKEKGHSITGSSSQSHYGTMSINYSIDENEHKINVPYLQSLRRAGNRFTVQLVDGNNELTDVTHQAGIPYFCAAKQLGGVGYKVVDRADNKTVIEYGEDEVPDLDSFQKYL